MVYGCSAWKQAAYAFGAGKVSIRRPGITAVIQIFEIDYPAFVLPLEGSIGEGLKGGNISSHHAEKVSAFRSVSTGGDHHAGEARILQLRDVLREGSVLPDEIFGAGIVFLNFSQGLHVDRRDFEPGFPEE